MANTHMQFNKLSVCVCFAFSDWLTIELVCDSQTLLPSKHRFLKQAANHYKLDWYTVRFAGTIW